MDIWGFVFIGLMILVGYMLRNVDYSKQKNETLNKIKQPYWYFNVGLSGIVGFTGIGCYFLFGQKEFISSIVMFIFALPYLIFIIFEKKWEIVFYDESFEFRNFFGIKKKYFYKDIDFKDTGRSLIIYINDKKIVGMSFLLKNVDKFQKKIEISKRKNKYLFDL